MNNHKNKIINKNKNNKTKIYKIIQKYNTYKNKNSLDGEG